MDKIQLIDRNTTKKVPQFTSCIILTQDQQLLLQKRPLNWRTYPGYVCCFGGHIEGLESPKETIIRELYEEVGAEVHQDDLVYLATYAEELTHYSEVISGYFWHDVQGTITGCYECEPLYINHPHQLASQNLVMDDVPWLIDLCFKKNLLPFDCFG